MKKRAAPRRKMVGLERGVVDADQLEWIKAVEAYRRKRPFPGLVEYHDILLSLGYSKSTPEPFSPIIDDLRTEYEARLAELRRADDSIGNLEFDLKETKERLKEQCMETIYAQEESARLLRLMAKGRELLSATATKSQIRDWGHELNEIKGEQLPIFGSGTQTEVAERQAIIESFMATVHDHLSAAVKTLAKA